MNCIANSLLTFFYIFSFSFRGGGGFKSSMLVAIFLLIYMLVNPKYFNKLIKFYKTTYFKNIIICYIVINIWAITTIIVNGSSDTSYLRSLFYSFFLIVTGACLYEFFAFKGQENNVVNYLVICFAIQAVIEWGAFILPPIKRLINMTKSLSTVEKGASYSGVRGNALAGSDFFGLSAAFAVMLLLFWSEKNLLFKNNKALKFILYIVIISGTFFAGRTGYVGLAFALIYLIINKENKKHRTRQIFWAGVAALGIIGFIELFAELSKRNESFYNLFNFTLQPLLNKISNGSFMISSLQSLRNMYFPIDAVTFIIGDGQYTTATGHYYMSTDAGYMRVILFMGVIGFLLLIFFQLFILSPNRGQEKKMKKMLFILLLVLNIKGEALAWGEIVVSITILYCMEDRFPKVSDGECYERIDCVDDGL